MALSDVGKALPLFESVAHSNVVHFATLEWGLPARLF
jgi:hypothetical protein